MTELGQLITVGMLREWFVENAEQYKRTYEQGMGVRCIEIDGDFLRSAPEGTLATFWKSVSKELPKDAVFVQWMDSQFVLQGVSLAGSYCDTYVVLLASKAWAQTEQGEMIPKLELGVNQDKTVTIKEEE
jgi:hypothetical protein